MRKLVVILLLLLTAIFGALMHLIGFGAENPVDARKAFAMAKMVTGLIVIWIFIGGALMYYGRDRIKAWVQALPGSWQVKFVLFATFLACAEEAITVSMTNLAPAFGSKIGEAYITASTNYFDVIFLHSVIMFVPTFIAWALILKRYDFSPFAVFLLHAVIGVLGEVTIIGPAAFLMFPMWAFVYGLMVYLPVYTLPPAEVRGAVAPRWYHYPLVVPAVLLLALPLLIPIFLVITGVLHHPGIDFAGG